jgi:hypothetical protein
LIVHPLVSWRRMDCADPGVEVLDALERIVGTELSARAAILPWLRAMRSSRDPRARRLAVALVAGATGVAAWRSMVAGLDDDDAEVRDAAVDAMAASCVAQPMRWAHALFHRRPEVRRLAATRTPESARVLLAWGRADPVIAAACVDAPWPAGGLALVDDLWRRRLVSAAEALQGLRSCTPVALRQHAQRGERRTVEQCAAFRAAARTASSMPPIHGRDAFDAWLDIASSADDGDWLVGELRDVVAGHDVLRQRLLVAICGTADRAGWSPVLACAALHANPGWLGFASVPVSVRRAALEATWPATGDATIPKAELAAICDALGRDDDGRVALARVATLAAWLAEDRVAAVLELLGVDQTAVAAADDLVGWATLVRLPFDDALPRVHDRIAVLRPEQAPACLALLVLGRLAHDEAAVLAPEGPCATERRALLRGLLEVSREPRLRPSLEAVQKLVAAIEASGPVPLSWWFDAVALGPAEVDVGTICLANALARDTAAVARQVETSSPDAAAALLRWCENLVELPRDVVAAASRVLGDLATQPDLAELLRRADLRHGPPPVPRTPVAGLRRLTSAEADRIATCDLAELDLAVAIALGVPCHGLTDALSRRTSWGPSLTVCAAIVACTDGLPAAAHALARFAAPERSFLDDLRYATLTLWRDSDAVPPLVDALLVAFERNAVGLATWFELQDGGYTGALRSATSLPSPARELMWWAIAQVLTTWSYRGAQRELLAGLDPALVGECVALLDTELGRAAAMVLVALHRGGVAENSLYVARSGVLARASQFDRATHDALASWIPLRGVASPRDRPARRLTAALPADERVEITRIDDPDALARVCERGGRATVAIAVSRLLELTGGEAELVRLLAGDLAHLDVLLDTLPRWSSEGRARAQAVAARTDVAIERRFRIAMALVRLGGPPEIDAALAIANDPHATRIAGVDDWPELLARSDDALATATRAVRAADPALADAALGWLMTSPTVTAAALRVAVTADAGPSPGLRRTAASMLLDRGDDTGLPLVLMRLVDSTLSDEEAAAFYRRTLRHSQEAADALVELAVTGGPTVASESRVYELLTQASPDVRDICMSRLLVECSDPKTRKRVAEHSWSSSTRGEKLRELAQTFAWGVMRGRELTGKVFSIHITPKREQWGFTHLGTTAIHVTPVPILAKAPRGRDVVEGLLLHEIGHHIWHGGKSGMRVWRRAQRENLHPLFNLVADEHLERNLRSIDAEFGDRIKRLDAYAFQHAPREMQVMELLMMLRADAPAVLADIGPEVAHDPACLRIEGGRVLGRLDELGHSFARFVRALRMGLGNRSGDAKVDLALTYFGAGFRSLGMHGLLRVTKAVAEIFGNEAALALGFGGHEAVEWNERDADVSGDGIRDDEVQREVQRILEPPRGNPHPQGPGGLMINVGGDAYKKLARVEVVRRDAAAHKAVASTVARHAVRLRETLEHLGLGHVPVGARMRGHAVDRGRLEQGIVRGDPRLLRAREIELASDLFLGVVVDCSGSMSGANLVRAARFAVLVAEAARGLGGVDTRFFGFTDAVIYDAGTAERCAAASLVAGGGNNDAAALDHAAQVALRSRRRSRLLVMISDGLPTECSVGALRGVVRSLTKRYHICCAQVAVRPLSEVCFAHYVLLDEENLDAAVRRFAGLIARLVGQALAM